MDKPDRRSLTHVLPHGVKRAASVLGLLALVFAAAGGTTADAQIDLSDTPMFTRILPPPANIVFLLDDSGSMNFEILVTGQYDGSFPNPEKTAAQLAVDPHGFCYLFDDVGDNVYSSTSQPDWYAGQEGRKLWKTQWFAVNAMFYNPNVAYAPWPGYASVTFTDADKDTPRSHPVNGSYTLDLAGTAFSVGGVSVPHARFVVFSPSQNRHYLVVLDKNSSSKRYYTFTVTGTGLAEKIASLSSATPPSDVVSARSYDEERQNFANWFTYYRRREFVAKNALAKVITALANVRVGIYGINQKIVAPLAPVNVTQGATVSDETNTLLGLLYPYQSYGGTALKAGLKTVGGYYKDNTGVLGTATGPKPYGTAAEGASCQQSFTVILTDGYYNDLGTTLDGNTDGSAGEPYADSHANTLADIAMYYYKTDLNPLADQVPVNKVDRAAHQHMATYAVAFGVNGTLNPADYDADLRHKVTGNPIQWTAPSAAYKPEAVDDLWHAAVNGRGRFFNANNPLELTAALNDLMAAIAEQLIGSASSVTVNGDYLYGKLGSNTVIYQALYSNKDNEWTGDLRAYPVDTVTGDVLVNSPKWSAAQKLKAKDWDKRLIASFNGTAGIPFWEGSLTAAQKTALGSDPANMVKYLRGGDVSGYRVRSQKLGDIVNSAPVFMDDVIYTGGNDGMLHAFDAATGEERFAYVPNLSFGNLKLLAEPAYAHRFFVDLTPAVKKGDNILYDGTKRTVLVGGLRKGGKGYFALDVTDAKNSITSEAALAGRVLWEFPKTADTDMGFSFSKPVIVRSNSSTHPWVVIFGNGYNSDSGKSALYIVNPATGDLIKRIDAGAGPDNGLSSPIAVDATYDGKADFVYAGDLKGNLWKFDLSRTNIADWAVAFSSGGVAQPLFQARGPGGTLQPITIRPDVMYHPEQQGYIVCFGTGKFLGDSDTLDASVQSVYGIWDYGDTVYHVRTKTWSRDDDTEFPGTFNRGSTPLLSNQPEKVTLLRQEQKVFSVTIGGIVQKLRFLSKSTPVWKTRPDPDGALLEKPDPTPDEANHAGYYFDLSSGERVISDVIIRNSLLLAIGFSPNTDRCGPGGNSIFMELNAFTGGYAGGSLFDISGDMQVNDKDLVAVDFDGTGTPQTLAPSGLEFFGNLQPPAILGFSGGGGGDPLDDKHMSSSSGKIERLREKGVKLGVTYWMEIRR